jgi:hypothetical protein
MGEVEFVLRKPISNDDDIKRVLVAAEAGLCFMDEVYFNVNRSVSISYLLNQLISLLLVKFASFPPVVIVCQLNSVARSLKLSRGALSRWLLPYDHNTRIDEQSSNASAVIDSMPDFLVGECERVTCLVLRIFVLYYDRTTCMGCAGRISDKQVQYLVTGLNGVRKLVRIKIADDNDLEQARTGLKLLSAFFQRLVDEAKEQDMSPYALLESRKG